VVLWATVVVWVALELRQGTRRRPEARSADHGSRRVLGLAAVVGVTLANLTRRLAPQVAIRPSAVAAAAGLVVLWCGIALRFWSFHTLGRYFTFTVLTSDDQPVIQTGPYRVVRHPSYAALLLAVIGVGLLLHNYLGLLVLTVTEAAAVVYRIRIEEAALIRDLGERYSSYAASHKRIIPFIW
jgi:protein-S-isoprenylcysteine O-methyltransferase Ste14